jgi:hypothetical protein
MVTPYNRIQYQKPKSYTSFYEIQLRQMLTLGRNWQNCPHWPAVEISTARGLSFENLAHENIRMIKTPVSNNSF